MITFEGRCLDSKHYRTTQWERPVSHRSCSRAGIPDVAGQLRPRIVSEDLLPPPSSNLPRCTPDSSQSRRRRHFMTRNELHGPPTPLPEGYEQRTTQQGQVYFLHTQTGVSTWHDPRIPRNLSHINPDDLGPLPSGWESRSTATGRQYYIDHSSRTTQFTDPRIGRYIGQMQNRSSENETNNG